MNHFPALANNNMKFAQLESYLIDLKSVAIDFNQTDSNDQHAQGRIILLRPNKFLCNYYPPYPMVIAGNDNYVSIYDYDLEQLTRIDKEENPLTSLLTEPKKFFSHLEHRGVNQIEHVSIFRFFNKDFGSEIWVSYNQDKKMISQIIIREFDSKIITINITNIYNITAVSDKLFIFKDPKLYKNQTRLNADELAKNYKILD